MVHTHFFISNKPELNPQPCTNQHDYISTGVCNNINRSHSIMDMELQLLDTWYRKKADKF